MVLYWYTMIVSMKSLSFSITTFITSVISWPDIPITRDKLSKISAYCRDGASDNSSSDSLVDKA